MSGKSAKKVRKVLGAIKFPVLNIAKANVIVEQTKDTRKVREEDVRADHARRITKLARTRGISIQAATLLYTQKMGMGPKSIDTPQQ